MAFIADKYDYNMPSFWVKIAELAEKQCSHALESQRSLQGLLKQGNRVKEQTLNPTRRLMPYWGARDSYDANLWFDAQSADAFTV